MKFLMPAALATLTLAGVAQARPDRSDAALGQRLIALERQSWVAWQRHDVPFWRSFLSADHVEIDNRVGVTGKQDVIDGIAGGQCTVAGYRLDRFTFRRIDRDTALLVYWADQDTSCAGRKVPSPVWATSLYERRGGRWVNMLYSHVPAPKPAG